MTIFCVTYCLICCLKWPYIVFLPIFVFWLFLFCQRLCCLHYLWSLQSVFLSNFLCSLKIAVSTHWRYLQYWWILSPLLFLSHIVCLHHLWDAWPYVILFSCPFVWSSPQVHFQNGPEYLTRGTASVFIPLMRFLLCSLFLSSFLVPLRYFFLLYPHVLWCLLPIFQTICRFPSLLAFWFFLWFNSSIPSIVCRFPLLIICMDYHYYYFLQTFLTIFQFQISFLYSGYWF